VQPGRVLAIDYGTRNVGLATSDELGVAVRPLLSLPNLGKRDLLKRLRTVIDELGIEAIVVGLPVNMDGSSGEAVDRIRRFARIVKQEFDLPLHEVDERLSTIEAAEIWKTMGERQRKKYRTLDSLAAAFILQRHLGES
jgi:putative Holliday junction resolvase